MNVTQPPAAPGPDLRHGAESFCVPATDRGVLSFRDLTVTVATKGGGERRLLDRVSGIVHSGEILAIMGPSGSGKTTLLDTLAGRISGVKAISGKILVNGRPKSLAFGTAAYVPQSDVGLFGTLTVRENISYAARLRLPSLSREEVDEVVETIIGDLGLAVCRDVRVGNWALRGISGGQKRRLSVAVELVTSPRILFLDEVTSGLDAASAYFVMKGVRNLAAEGRTVACTIHQPSTEVFELLDSLMLLASGRPVWVGKISETCAFFSKAGFPCSPSYPLQDHVLKVVNKDFASEEGGDAEAPLHLKSSPEENIERLAAQLASSDHYHELLSEIDRQAASPGAVYVKTKEPSLLHAVPILVQRSSKNLLNNYAYLHIRLAMYIVICICLGTIFLDLGTSWTDCFNRLSLLFFCSAFLSFMTLAAITALIEDVMSFLRERMSGWYGTGSYAVANFITSLPFLFVISLISSLCCYFLAGLRSGGSRFFKFVFILFLALEVTESLFIFLTALYPNFYVVMGLGAGLMGIFMLVCGFFKSLPELTKPVWRYPLSYISMHTYSFEAFANNEFRGGNRLFDCPCSVQPGGCPGPCVISGEEVLDSYGVPDRNFFFDVGILIAMALGYRLMFYLVLKAKELRRRRAVPKMLADD